MSIPDPVDLDRLASTRRCLHGLAELVLAGPQFERSGSIELRVTPGGFGTTAEPDLRVDGLELVAGHRREPIAGRSLAELAAAVGVSPRALADVYSEGPGLVADDVVDADPAAAQVLAAGFEIGDKALARLAPKRPRILWPEHFDVGIDDDEVNYGVSPGDANYAEPYAYVGPWSFSGQHDDFWNAPFGAARTVRELETVDGLVAFFEEGRRRARR